MILLDNYLKQVCVEICTPQNLISNSGEINSPQHTHHLIYMRNIDHNAKDKDIPKRAAPLEAI